MIRICCTPGAQSQAEKLGDVLRGEYPGIPVAVGHADCTFAGTYSERQWDDLMVVVFADDPLSGEMRVTIERALVDAKARGRVGSVVPVATLATHPVPPAPLDEIKAWTVPDPTGEDGRRLVQRIGALLGLWLRGDDLKIFVSHRQSDGKALATQVTDYLKSQGYDAWRDEEQLKAGDIVQAEIEQHVAGAHALLLLDTPDACQSEWIWREVNAGIKGFVPIVPVILRPAEAVGEAAGPGFRNAAELFSHRVEVQLDGAGVVLPLADPALDGLLATMEGYLSRVLRAQAALAAKVEASFGDAGFDWKILDPQRRLYSATKRDEYAALTRLLALCSTATPRAYWAVRALQTYVAGSPGQPAGVPQVQPMTLNHRLFVYEPPLPRPEWLRLAEEHGFDQDPSLRVLDPGRLAQFLSRF